MEQNLEYALRLSVAGISIVFTSLIIISLVVSIMRQIDEKIERRKADSKDEEPKKEQTLDNTTLVLISAAAAATVRHRNFRIRSVRRIVSRDARGAGWTMQGRSVLHGSHIVNMKSDR